MPNHNPARDPREHGPPAAPGPRGAPGQRGAPLLATALALLAPGPLLATAALATRDPWLAALAARICRAALELSAALGVIAALRHSRR